MKRQIRRLDRVPPRKYPPARVPAGATGAGWGHTQAPYDPGHKLGRQLQRTTTARQLWDDVLPRCGPQAPTDMPCTSVAEEDGDKPAT
eukprot:2816300-Prymnesium_polylepis.1